MEEVLIVIHLIIVVALVIVVLLQRSEGGALGMGGGGGGGGGGGFMSARGAANALTRTTAILAACFFLTSIALGVLSGYQGGSVIVDQIPTEQNVEGDGNGILDQIGGPVGDDDAKATEPEASEDDVPSDN